MNGVFIGGTDTGCGKTLVTGLLARALRDRGTDTETQKWVQTGARPGQGDLRVHDRLGGRRGTVAPEREPYCLPLPASPQLAARTAGRSINLQLLMRAYRVLARRHDLVLVEGSGGLLVPYTARLLQLDLVARLRLPVILVVANRLGAINQALLSVEALRTRRLRLLGLIFSAAARVPAAIAADNVKVISARASAPVLAVLPHTRAPRTLLPHLRPLAARLQQEAAHD